MPGTNVTTPTLESSKFNDSGIRHKTDNAVMSMVVDKPKVAKMILTMFGSFWN
jgi:hypothetical protein